MEAGPSSGQNRPAAASSSNSRVRKAKKYDLNTLKAKTNELFGIKMKTERASGMKYEYAESKTNYVAEKWRVEGMALFKEERYRESILRFTQSVAAAPPNSEELATAYAHRSSALLRLGEYEACLLDINRAIQVGCSETLKKQLRKRKLDCLKERQQVANTERTGIIPAQISSGATDPADMNSVHDTEELERRVFTSTEVFDGEVNALLPDTTSKIELIYDEEMGARMVAKEDLPAGDFLSIEEFFVMQLDYEKRVYHCSYCFSRCDSLIPCPTCSREMYCCDSCRNKAYESYHRVECQIIHFYQREGAEWRDMLVMRAFLLATKQGDEFHVMMEKVTLENIFQKIPDPPKLPFVNDLSSAFDIMRTSRMFDNERLLMYIEELLPLAVDAVPALRSISFFGTTSWPRTLTEEELFTVIFLAKNYVLLGWGAFKINAQTKKTSTQEHVIGFGVNVLQNFYLYSCNPNTHGFIENRHRITYTTRTVKAGEQLFFTENHAYAYQPIADRLKQFAEQGYTCDCEACVGDWPSWDGLKAREIQFKNNASKSELIKAMRDMLNKTKASDIEDGVILKIVIHLMKLLCATLKMPSYDILICEELLTRFMNNYYSDFHWSDASLKHDFGMTVNSTLERLSNANN